MPVIGTSGALATNKVYLDETGINWLIQWALGNNTDNGVYIQNIIFDDKNQLYAAGSSPLSGFSRSLIVDINQTYGIVQPLWQRTIYGSYTNRTFENVYYKNNKIYLTGKFNSPTTNYATGITTMNYDGSNIQSYVDSGIISGSSQSYPAYRYPYGIVADSNNNMYILGINNEKPNSTTNNYQLFVTKYNESTKINSKILQYISPGSAPSSTGYIAWDSTGTNLILGSNLINGSSRSAGVMNYNPITFTINWQFKYDLPSGSTNIQSNWIQDSNGNIIISTIVTGGASAGLYIAKLNSSGFVLYTKKILSATLVFSQLAVDDGGNIYASAFVSSGRIVIVKIDPTLSTIIWQRRLNVTSYGLNRIIYKDNFIYYVGALSTKEFIMKVPSDGTIPGNGTYTTPYAGTLTYTIDNAVSLINGTPNAWVPNAFTVQTPIDTDYAPLSSTVSNTIATASSINL